MGRIQIIAICTSVLFLLIIARLIIKGRLREEYAIVWIVSTLVLLVFSFWRDGLEVLSKLMGIIAAPNLVFTGAIFAILIYLLHLSMVVSGLQEQNKTLAQEIALTRQKMQEMEKDKHPENEQGNV
ncbi:MAG: DUF2304 domain-containing protein [Bacteroidia bacterium]